VGLVPFILFNGVGAAPVVGDIATKSLSSKAAPSKTVSSKISSSTAAASATVSTKVLTKVVTKEVTKAAKKAKSTASAAHGLYYAIETQAGTESHILFTTIRVLAPSSEAGGPSFLTIPTLPGASTTASSHSPTATAVSGGAQSDPSQILAVAASKSRGRVAGAVVGVLIALIALGVSLCVWLRRRRTAMGRGGDVEKGGAAIEAFPVVSGGEPQAWTRPGEGGGGMAAFSTLTRSEVEASQTHLRPVSDAPAYQQMDFLSKPPPPPEKDSSDFSSEPLSRAPTYAAIAPTTPVPPSYQETIRGSTSTSASMQGVSDEKRADLS